MADREIPLWVILSVALAALIAAIAALIFWRKRQAERFVPQIERPVVAQASGEASGETLAEGAASPRYDLHFEVEGVTRSLMALTVTGHLEIRNRSDRALRDLAIAAELTTAHSMQRKAVGKGAVTQLTELEPVGRIGPHQSQSRKLNLRVNIADIGGVRHGGVPVIVPLVQIRTQAVQGEEHWNRFALGLPSEAGTGRLQPLRLEGPPGGFAGVRARRVD